MRTQRLSSTLHLGTLHDVFVQMISLACRQPNYLSSSVSSRPKITSPRLYVRRDTHTHTLSLTRTHTHARGARRRASGPPVCHSAPAVSWKRLLCRSALTFRGLMELRGGSCLPWCSGSSFVLLTWFLFILSFTVSINTQRVDCFSCDLCSQTRETSVEGCDCED